MPELRSTRAVTGADASRLPRPKQARGRRCDRCGIDLDKNVQRDTCRDCRSVELLESRGDTLRQLADYFEQHPWPDTA